MKIKFNTLQHIQAYLPASLQRQAIDLIEIADRGFVYTTPAYHDAVLALVNADVLVPDPIENRKYNIKEVYL